MTISVYTGSKVWDGPPRIGPSKKGHVEHGPGLYFTTSSEVARTYAKGQRTILRVELETPLRWLEDAVVPTTALVYWVGSRRGLRKKQAIIDDLMRSERRTEERLGAGMSYAAPLVNLMVNYEVITGDHGPALAEYLVSLGIDASHVRRGDTWVVLFNPAKVISWRKVRTDDPWDLPEVKRTSRP